MSVEEAVNRAVDDCIAENVLAEFLKAHRAEVLDVYLAEIDEVVLRQNLIAEGRQEGRQEEYNANLQKLKNKIQRKLDKNKSLEQIAEELEENIEDIRPLYDELTVIS